MGAVKEMLEEDIEDLAKKTGKDLRNIEKEWFECCNTGDGSYYNFKLGIIRGDK